MADTLENLADSSSYAVLQEKLEKLKAGYEGNTCDDNLGEICQLIELTGKIQNQLFTAMSQTSSSGGTYGGIDTIKGRLLPWMGAGFMAAGPNVSKDTSLALIKESVEKDRKLAEEKEKHSDEVTKLEIELATTKNALDETKDSLNNSQAELDKTKTEASGTMAASEEEIILLKTDLRLAKDEASRYKLQLDLLGDYERELGNLKDDVSILRGERDLLEARYPYYSKDYPYYYKDWWYRYPWYSGKYLDRYPYYSKDWPYYYKDWWYRYPYYYRKYLDLPSKYLPLSTTPLRSLPLPPASPTHAELTNSVRHSRLVARFNDLYAVDRLDMQDRLRRYVLDDDMVKKIIFIAVNESFHAAKMAFRSFRLRARKLLLPIHSGPLTLEEAVSDYCVRNLDLYDVEKSIDEVVKAMDVNPKISFPAECDFNLLSPFIREVCKVAYEMQALSPPLDVPLATDGELMSEVKYRRSYDSEFTAPLVAFHVWPALMEDGTTLIKGEATTKRAYSPRRSPRRY